MNLGRTNYRNGGTRGGADQFKWDDVKNDKYRENYLGHSVCAPVGRWQKNKDLTWYAKASKEDRQLAIQREIQLAKQRDQDLLNEALGIAPVRRNTAPNHQLDSVELKELLKRGESERDALNVERVEGLGAAPVASDGFEMAPRKTLAERYKDQLGKEDTTYGLPGTIQVGAQVAPSSGSASCSSTLPSKDGGPVAVRTADTSSEKHKKHKDKSDSKKTRKKDKKKKSKKKSKRSSKASKERKSSRRYDSSSEDDYSSSSSDENSDYSDSPDRTERRRGVGSRQRRRQRESSRRRSSSSTRDRARSQSRSRSRCRSRDGRERSRRSRSRSPSRSRYRTRSRSRSPRSYPSRGTGYSRSSRSHSRSCSRSRSNNRRNRPRPDARR